MPNGAPAFNLTGSDRPAALAAAARRLFRCLVAMCAALLGVFLALSVVQAQGGAPPAPPALTISPATVTLSRGETVEALVVARSQVTATLQGLQLSSVPAGGLAVAIRPPLTSTLLPGAALVWRVQITRTGERPAAGPLYLQLDYRTQDGVPGVSTGSLEIQDRLPLEMGKVATAYVESALSQIQDNQSGLLYVVVNNVSAMPVTVTGISTAAPDFIALAPLGGPTSGVRLEPQMSHSFPFSVTAGSQVRPGKETLLFEVGLQWADTGGVRRSSLVLTRPLTVGILGQLDILTALGFTALGLPTLFLAPGFLVLMILQILTGLFAIDKPKVPDIKTPQFWSLAVLFSLAAAFIYPLFTHKSYLQVYGLQDIAFLWSGACAAGVVLFALGIVSWAGATLLRGTLFPGLAASWGRLRAWWHDRQFVPSRGDWPVDVLYKLARNGMPFAGLPVHITLGNQTVDGFVISPDLPGNLVWVAPAAQLQQLGADAAYWGELAGRLDAVNEPGPLAELIKSGEQRRPPLLRASWVPSGALTGPRQVDKGQLTTAGQVPVRMITGP
ncbi:MAG: hypothetical protein EXR62_16560 [Chloroflexi bacterium]|nr:hypothetical protein [Chloroflexota bacterium]